LLQRGPQFTVQLVEALAHRPYGRVASRGFWRGPLRRNKPIRASRRGRRTAWGRWPVCGWGWLGGGLLQMPR
jgi:hypothetical protein